MTNISNILDIGRTALLAQQKAIDITGRNIANADTQGYTRQRVTFSNQGPTSLSQGIVGVDIGRVYDRYLEAQITSAIQATGRWNSQQSGLERIEILFDESSGTGLSQRLNAFWNAWMDLSNLPSGPVERNQLLARSRELTTLFNGLSANLSQLQQQANTTIKHTIDSINAIAGQLAELNGRIRQGDLAGSETNALKDARLQLLKELAEKVDVTAHEQEDGTLSVTLASGNPLVENTRFMELDTAPPGIGPFQDAIVWVDGQGNETVITDQIGSGELKGLLEVRDQIIPDIMGRLDSLAGGMITEVNAVHTNGRALDGTQNAFFTGSTAADITVNTAILNDPDKIAAAGPSESVPGGNGAALAISALQSAALMNGGTTNFGQYYTSLVSDIGGDLQTANLNASHQHDVSAGLVAYRESISGVSLDEEMVRLIQYQHAFEAAAQLINVADEMLETVIQMI